MVTLDFKTRPLSWSAISSFEWSPSQWYDRYILNKPDAPSAEMEFGKVFGKSCEDGKPLAPVTILPVMEHKFSVVFNGIPLVGYADTFCPKTNTLCEYKTSAKPWTQKKVDEHGQLTMYALMHYITTKVKPEDMKIVLENVLTEQDGNYRVRLKQPVKVFRFETKRTMQDLLEFGVRINKTVEAMREYVKLSPPPALH